MEQKLCEVCHYPLAPNFYFCPNCGKKIKETPPSTSFGKQVSVYAISVFLPPLGLWPGVKYLLQKDEKAKLVGIVAIILTILSTLISTLILINVVNQINQSVQTQLNQYQNIGF